MSAFLRWYCTSPGVVVRKGQSYTTPPYISETADLYTTSDPILPSDWAKWVKDSVTSRAGNGSPLKVVADPAGGKKLRMDFQALSKAGGMSTFPRVDDANNGWEKGTIEYDVQFGNGSTYDFGKGGKLPGLGGFLPGQPDKTTAPTGGNPDNRGWSSRLMWLADAQGGNVTNGIELIGYVYDPTQGTPSNTVYGQNKHTLVSLQAGKYTLKQQITMNSIKQEGISGNPDGTHRIFCNGTLVYENTAQVFRIYQAARLNQIVWSSFYGGADDTWAPQTAQYQTFDNFKLTPALV